MRTMQTKQHVGHNMTIARSKFACLQLAAIAYLLAVVVVVTTVSARKIESSFLVEERCNLGLVRLPRHFEPINYNLLIRPDLKSLTFEGQVVISLKFSSGEALPSSCKRLRPLPILVLPSQKTPLNCKRSKIVLHADKDVRINQVSFDSHNGKQIRVKQLCRDVSNEMIVIYLSQELEPQSAGGAVGQLTLGFEGKIREDFNGLCRAAYRNKRTGKNEYMALTQFEAAHARKAFPCLDEPNFKATFNVTIEHPSHLTALSNMEPIRREETTMDNDGGGGGPGRGPPLTRVQFATTPPMSIHLLAFAIGKFDHIDATASDGMQIAIWTPPGMGPMAEQSLGHAIRAYSSLKEYFNISQPLKKIDFVSTLCHKMGFMENWGLIALTERFLFATAELTDPYNMLFAGDAITREISRNWLGNLVSINWWDEKWLNEGFATWITQHINQRLYPAAKGELIYLADYFDLALTNDAQLDGTQAINNNMIKYKLATPDQIEEAEGASFLKVAAILRMLNAALGTEKMRQSITRYLRDNSYKNAAAEDLWQSMEESSGFGVSNMMTSWLDQAGFPLVKVKLARNGRYVQFQQQRFVSDSDPVTESGGMMRFITGNPGKRHEKWTFPMTIRMSGQVDGTTVTVERKVVMTETDGSIGLPKWIDLTRTGHWIKFNADFVGFYRVIYDDKRLVSALEFPIRNKLMSAEDRLNFICDTRALFSSGHIDLAQLERVLNWYENEDDDAIIGTMSNIIVGLQQLEDDELEEEEEGDDDDGSDNEEEEEENEEGKKEEKQEEQETSSGEMVNEIEESSGGGSTKAEERAKYLFNYFERTGQFGEVAGENLLRKRTRQVVLNALNLLLEDKMGLLGVEHLLAYNGKNVPNYLRKEFCKSVVHSASDDQLDKLIQVRRDNNWEGT